MEALGVLLIVIGIVFILALWTGTLDKVTTAVFG